MPGQHSPPQHWSLAPQHSIPQTDVSAGQHVPPDALHCAGSQQTFPQQDRSAGQQLPPHPVLPLGQQTSLLQTPSQHRPSQQDWFAVQQTPLHILPTGHAGSGGGGIVGRVRVRLAAIVSGASVVTDPTPARAPISARIAERLDVVDARAFAMLSK